MSLSQTALQAVLAQSIDKVFLELLEITHDDLAEPIRLVNDTQDLVRSAGTFAAFPFQVVGMRQSKDQLPQMRVTIDNVDQRVLLALRGVAGTREDIRMAYEVVLADSPDTVEYGPIDFRVDGASVSPTAIALDLSFHTGFLSRAFPAGQFAPSNAA